MTNLLFLLFSFLQSFICGHAEQNHVRSRSEVVLTERGAPFLSPSILRQQREEDKTWSENRLGFPVALPQRSALTPPISTLPLCFHSSGRQVPVVLCGSFPFLLSNENAFPLRENDLPVLPSSKVSILLSEVFLSLGYRSKDRPALLCMQAEALYLPRSPSPAPPCRTPAHPGPP